MVIASCALSLGVNTRGVEMVLHFMPPRRICDYVQQAGRAGRCNWMQDLQLPCIVYFTSASLVKVDKTMHEYCTDSSACKRQLAFEHVSPNFDFHSVGIQAMMHLKPPENEFMEGRALAYVHELKSFVNDKLGRGERTIELEVLQKRAAVWKQFVSFEALIDVLGLKILNMAQRPEPLPRVHYTHMIMTLQLAFVAYKVPNCPSLKCRRLKFCSRPQGPRLVGSLLTWPKKTRSNGSRGCGLPLPTQKI